MSPPDQQNYLQSKILTAAPHQLHLMLIEGAIRFGRQAEHALRRGDQAAADTATLRALDIVGEMLAGVRAIKSELNAQIANFYLYLFRTIGEAKVDRDAEKIAVALRLLDYEHQTWQLLCEPAAASATDVGSPPAGGWGGAAQPPIGMRRQNDGLAAAGGNASLSLQA